MKSSQLLRLFSLTFLLAMGAMAKGGSSTPGKDKDSIFTSGKGPFLALTATSANGIPEFSNTTCGITLLASENSKFTKLTGEWSYDSNEVSSGEGELPGVEYYTQFIAVDLLPIPLALDNGFPVEPLAPVCPNFLQVGTNVTEFFTDPEFFPGVPFAWAFYIWNNVTTNITDASGNLVEFIPGEHVTVTILLSDDGVDATVIYNSTVQGLIEIDLSGGSLCLDSVQWAFGSPPSVEALFGASDFNNSTATEIDITTGVTTVLGPDSGDHTLLAVDGEIYYEAFAPDNQGLSFVAEPDCPDY